MIEDLKPGTWLTTTLTVILIVVGFCMVAPGAAWTGSPAERRAAIEQQLDDLGLKWQGLQYLREKNNAGATAKDKTLKERQEAVAKEAGKLQQELKGLTADTTGVVPGKKGKK